MMWDGYGFGMGLGWLVPLAVVALVVWVILRMNRGNQDGAGGNRALDILKERYARGEITREEFESMRRDIE